MTYLSIHTGTQRRREESQSTTKQCDTTTTYWTRIQQFLEEGTVGSDLLLIRQQQRSHSGNHMNAKHVKLNTWPQKERSLYFPIRLCSRSLCFIQFGVFVWWTNLASPASSALTGHHPLQRRHWQASWPPPQQQQQLPSRAQKTPVWWQTPALYH